MENIGCMCLKWRCWWPAYADLAWQASKLRAPPFVRRAELVLLELLVNKLPVDHLPPFVDILLHIREGQLTECSAWGSGETYRTTVLVIEVVGVFPDVKGEQGLHTKSNG